MIKTTSISPCMPNEDEMRGVSRGFVSVGRGFVSVPT